MATGPEHYIEAERLLKDSIVRGGSDEDYGSDRPSLIDFHATGAEGIGNHAAAQVHATLALAAAVAEAHQPNNNHWGPAFAGDLLSDESQES